MPEKRGKFIVFDGIDGSGKTTQAKLFSMKLFDASKFNYILLTREPYDSEEIRRRLAEEADASSNANLMADLFIEDRKKHLTNLILPNLQRGVYVISDRYKLSTIAYQSTQGLDIDELISRHEGFIVPDLTYFIDVPVEVALERMRKQAEGRERKFEQPEFQEKLRENYLTAINKLTARGENIYIIEGTSLPEIVSALVWKRFNL